MKLPRWARRAVRWALASLLALTLLLAGFWFLFPKTARSRLTQGGGELLLRYTALRSGAGWFETGFARREDVQVPMRDGVRLATDLYLPTAPGPHPAIVVRTPYTKREAKLVAEFFARYGYAVAVQDTRGRHKSEGQFYPFRHEQNDGLDFTKWVKRQPWCNGRIGGFGGSYLGFVQWAMAAGNSDLASISPTFITANLYNGIYQGGAFGKQTFLHWSLSSYGRYGDGRGAANVQRGYRHFPLIEADDAALRDIDFYDDWVSHPEPDSYWRDMSADHRFSEISAPAFLVAGWYDFFRDAQIRDFQSLRSNGSEAARSKSKILIGPWSHSFFNANLKNYGIRQGRLELLPFEFVKESKAWLDYSLKGASNGWDSRPAVRAYVLGENTWREAEEWPPREVSYRSFYLHSGGKARTLYGDGALSPEPPAKEEPADSFVFDPSNPVPSVGGSHGDQWTSGPADQREVEKREDVLVFSSEPLKEPLLVMGPVKARLFASSSAPDTDFTAKLVDVFEDGRALILCEGVIRTRYREGLERPKLMQPGVVYPLEIEMGNTSVRFRAGHRIRLEISSSNSPRYDVNPNTGRPIATERNPVQATQTILHNETAPSALVLPAIR
jgi:putative CocE/NonD family hydrolase